MKYEEILERLPKSSRKVLVVRDSLYGAAVATWCVSDPFGIFPKFNLIQPRVGSIDNFFTNCIKPNYQELHGFKEEFGIEWFFGEDGRWRFDLYQIEGLNEEEYIKEVE